MFAAFVIAAIKNDNDELGNEIADLLYHVLVLMECQALDIKEIMKILEDRRNNERVKNYR